MNLSKLFKKTSTGAIQYWSIETYEDPDTSTGWAIETEYGQVGTDDPQITVDIVYEGKNVGKANETTPHEQADAEAKAKHEKQLKKGYNYTIEQAQNGETHGVIEGGIVPMLAHTFEKQGKKIKYPCYTQPKLDGLRMIAVLKNGKCTLWSRTRKRITSLPHIIKEIEGHFHKDVILDGEAYNHEFKSNFEHIVHLVRQEEPDPACADVQYHVYDMVNDDSFEERHKELFRFFHQGGPKLKYLQLVETEYVQNEDQVSEFYSKYKDQGYEGAMLRNAASQYVNKRSSDLIKVKEMQDEDFEILGIEEGRGKLSGMVGAFVCRIGKDSQFNVKMSGETERLRDYFENHSLWKGKKLTVQFQDLTSYGIPRFPVGLRIRESE